MHREVSMYDALAGHYRSYSEKRSAYIEGVDRFILDEIPAKAEALLDVGAGDGVRGMALASRKGIRTTVLCDSSREMIERCRTLDPSQVIFAPAQELPSFERKFDVILMLWNVLGHIELRSDRVGALRRIAEAMNESAVFFLDVNNRHNGAAYGWMKAVGRVVIDTMFPDESRGDVAYTWEVDGKSIPGKGHLFTLAEIHGLLSEAGLKVCDQVFIDYQTGVVSGNRFKGQIVLKVGRVR